MVTKANWIELIKDFHENGVPASIPREINVPLETPINRAIVIIGPRRTGKTYLMYHLISELMKKTKKEQILYVNLEKSSLGNLNYSDLNMMLEAFYDLYPENKKQKLYLFLDEIQTVNQWEKFVRTCLDDGIKIYLSGSSSKLLSKEIATVMRGRSLTYNLFPFSFREFLTAKKVDFNEHLSSSEKARIRNEFSSYFEYGGYPETIIYPEKRENILSEILDVTIYKDVIERAKIRNVKSMKILIDALINSKEFSVHGFYNYLKSIGVKAGKNVLYNYIEYLNDAFFVFMLKKFSISYKKVEQSIPKPYITDTGFYKIKNMDDKSRLMENLVFIELTRRGKEINYFSYPSGEVDFLIRTGKSVSELIQVCYDLSRIGTKEREIKSLIKASEEFKCNNLLVITWDYESEEKFKEKKIKFIPLWKWLLENGV